MTTFLLILVAAGLVLLAVQAMIHLDRASSVVTPSGVPVRHRHERQAQLELRGGIFASPVLFVLSAVLALLVIAAVV